MFDASKWRAIVVANINFTKYDEICSEFATEFFIMSMYKWKGTEKNNIHANHDTEDSVKSMCQTDRISKFMIRYTTKVEEKQKKRNIHSRGKCKHVAVFFSLLLILSHESDPFLSRAKSQRIIPSHEIEMISLKKKKIYIFNVFNCRVFHTKNTSNVFDYISTGWRSPCWRHFSMSTKESTFIIQSTQTLAFSLKALNWRN